MTDRSNDPHNDSARDVTPIYPGSSQPRSSQTLASRSRPSLFWPIALIGFGILLLLSNMGLIPATGWAFLWRFWPIALIALGLDVLIGRRSVAGAVVSGFIILLVVGIAIGAALFAEQIPLLVDLAKAPILQVEHVEHPLGGIEAADVTIDYTSLPASLDALSDSGNLIEADVAYRGNLVFDVSVQDSYADVTLDTYQGGISYSSFDGTREDSSWDVGLASGVEFNLNLDTSSGAGKLDLRDLNIVSLNLDAGSGRVSLMLPANSSFNGTIDGGSGAMEIALPSGVGMRLKLDDGSGSFSPGERLRFVSGDLDDDSVWETEGYTSADYQIELSIDQGSGSLSIQ